MTTELARLAAIQLLDASERLGFGYHLWPPTNLPDMPGAWSGRWVVCVSFLDDRDDHVDPGAGDHVADTFEDAANAAIAWAEGRSRT